MPVELKVGDITEEKVDAIVNAANAHLAGGGGVDGAIHCAGGPSIMAECKELGGCPTGQAVATGAGNLKAKWVIHAVAPRNKDPKLLRSAYENSLRVAETLGAKSIAFPSLGTGAYGFPIEEAAKIVAEVLGASDLKVRLVLFSEEDFEVYKRAFE